MTITTNLQQAKEYIAEEIQDWEAQGKPQYPDFNWNYDTETYLLYDEVIRLEKELEESRNK